jgi:hypothetical protein
MKTFVTVTFSTEGARPSVVVDALHNLGFEPTTGNYDGVYTWDKQATIEDAIYLIDKVISSLKGMKVLLKFETVGNNESEREPEEEAAD